MMVAAFPANPDLSRRADVAVNQTTTGHDAVNATNLLELNNEEDCGGGSSTVIVQAAAPAIIAAPDFSCWYCFSSWGGFMGGWW